MCVVYMEVPTQAHLGANPSHFAKKEKQQELARNNGDARAGNSDDGEARLLGLEQEQLLERRRSSTQASPSLPCTSTTQVLLYRSIVVATEI